MLYCFLILLSFFTGAGNTAFREDVDNYLKQNLKNYDHYEFEILQAPENSNKIIINNDRPFSQNGGYANINVTVIDKKNSVSQSYITLKLKLYKNVLVSSQDIKSKEEISPEKVELKKLEVTFVKGEMFEKPEELAGNVAKMRINKGRIITSDIIEIAPVIKSGDLVNASAVRGNVIVTTDAIAKQDGRPGELIRILTRDNKQFKGKVIDSNNVIIIE